MKINRKLIKIVAYSIVTITVLFSLVASIYGLMAYNKLSDEYNNPYSMYSYRCADANGTIITKDFAGLFVETKGYGTCFSQGTYIKEHCFVPDGYNISICQWSY